MSQVNVSQTPASQNQTEINSEKTKADGSLKSASGEYSVEYVSESESLSQGAFELLKEMNTPEEMDSSSLQNYGVYYFSSERIDIELDIFSLLTLLEQSNEPTPLEKTTPSPMQKQENTKTDKKDKKAENSTEASHTEKSQGESLEIYTSLFSLAKTFNHNLSRLKNDRPQQNESKSDAKVSSFPQAPLATHEKQSPFECLFNKSSERPYKEKDKDQQGGQQSKDEEAEKRQKKEEMRKKVSQTKASKNVSTSTERPVASDKAFSGVESMENIFIRFMALMAKILGQAEAEAHELYLRIKERTDNIDVLSLLLSKINSEKKDIDWSKNDEMKQLLEKAKQLGVDIPDGKYKWSENEKKLLKENIQMRKDSMEKITQLERTDMQRYLQEASQCHQARSNVLKLLKEVVDTIVHNMRPS